MRVRSFQIGRVGVLWIPLAAYGGAVTRRAWLWTWEPDHDWWWFRLLGFEVSIAR